MRFYDPSSFSVLIGWVTQVGGELSSGRQVASITSDPGYSVRLLRQHVVLTQSGTLLIENALHYPPGNLPIKVYWNALESQSNEVKFRTLPRQRPGHYVYHPESVPWLASSSVSS